MRVVTSSVIKPPGTPLAAAASAPAGGPASAPEEGPGLAVAERGNMKKKNEHRKMVETNNKERYIYLE